MQQIKQSEYVCKTNICVTHYTTTTATTTTTAQCKRYLLMLGEA